MNGVKAEQLSSTKIVGIRRLAADVLLVNLSRPSGFTWSPGQHVGVSTTASGQLSYYSIASACLATNAGVLDLAIRESALKWPLPLEVGLGLFLSSPSGGPPSAQIQGAPDLTLIGMGTGVAPLRAVLQARLSSALTEKQVGRVRLLQGARRAEECIFLDEFRALEGPHFEYRPVLSQPSLSWAGRSGHVQDHLDDVASEQAFFCICGNLEMVGETTARLQKLGAPADAIFSEGY